MAPNSARIYDFVYIILCLREASCMLSFFLHVLAGVNSYRLADECMGIVGMGNLKSSSIMVLANYAQALV